MPCTGSPDYSRTAAELIAFNARLGLGHRLGGVQYGRILEYSRVYESLRLDEDSRLLDVGTGKHSILPWFCAYQTGCEVHITDIGRYVTVQRRTARFLPELRAMHGAGSITIERHDATSLAYRDEVFDAVTAISAIEHIPDDGDSGAVREAFRVLKPGGTFAVTVPLARGGAYWERYRPQNTYERQHAGAPVFFARYYDDSALRERIIDAAPFSQASVELWDDHDWYRRVWCERVPFRNVVKRLMGWWLTRRSIRNFVAVERYEGSGAWFGIVVLRK
jgi:SAM-dependent methyltransferase